ncbi:hypothetical protein ACQPZP_27485 [Spirillospora sp. CA-142024]|uniref:hypothetical protein n=1 Tax=Spirillospora sp. CA-142024 TaxID=3240036 RepID=UPI003D94815C
MSTRRTGLSFRTIRRRTWEVLKGVGRIVLVISGRVLQFFAVVIVLMTPMPHGWGDVAMLAAHNLPLVVGYACLGGFCQRLAVAIK